MGRVLVSTTAFKEDYLEDVLTVFSRLGWKDVDINLTPFMEQGYVANEVAKLVDDLDLDIGYLSGGWCDFFHDGEALEHTLASVNRQVGFARQLGVNRLRLFFGRLSKEFFGANEMESVIGNIRRLGTMHPDMRFSFENHDGVSLNPNIVLEIIRSVSLPNVGLTFDPINYARAGVDPLPALGNHHPLIYHVHVKGLTKDLNYCEYGAGTFDFFAVLKKLKELNYRGDFTLEYEGSGHPVMRSFHSYYQLLNDLVSLGFEIGSGERTT